LVTKRFPANTTLKELTFLNDKKVDAELYAYFQSISHYDEDTKVTRVNKWDLPSQVKICSVIQISSPKTYRAHLAYLIE